MRNPTAKWVRVEWKKSSLVDRGGTSDFTVSRLGGYVTRVSGRRRERCDGASGAERVGGARGLSEIGVWRLKRD